MLEIPGYSIERVLGQGGMATVYLAVQQSLGRHVALKLLIPSLARDPVATERFLREARIAAKLHHPHIIEIHDVGIHDGLLLYAKHEDELASVIGHELAHLSQRHFARLFRSETGLTPAAYVQQRRLDAARDLLESTSLPLNHIARNCGLGSSETLRRVMADQVGVSPEAYRSRFSH